MGRDPEYLAFLRARLAAPGGTGRTVADARREHAADLARSPRPPVDTVADLTVRGPAPRPAVPARAPAEGVARIGAAVRRALT
ncbi:hypothetical protein ACQEU6_06070 [Spirillospora sp. CA-108201]